MRSRRYILVLLLLMLALLPCAAQAKTVQTGDLLFGAAGDIRIPIYKDYSDQIGEGLTQDDFILTFHSLSDYMTIDAQGQITMRADTPYASDHDLEITYTPKVAGMGKTTTFRLALRVLAPISEVTASTYDLTIEKGKTEHLTIHLKDQGNAGTLFPVEYDNAIIKLNQNWGTGRISMTVTGVQTGETTIRVTAYNGKSASVRVHVVDDISRIEFGQSAYEAFQWETIDLKMDYGNGSVKLWPALMQVFRDGMSVDYKRYFPEDAGHFHAIDPGYFDVTIGHYGPDMTAKTVKIAVYQQAVCERIEISTGDVYLGRDNMRISILDAEGVPVVLPIAITQGSDIASIDGAYLRTTGYGTVTLTVTNSDGTTTSRSFEVKANPTQMALNATDLTLEIGEIFGLEVRFDQGRLNYEYEVSFDQENPEYDLPCVRLEGDRVIAQAPGSATITVKAGYLKTSCHVTVADGPGRLIFHVPEKLGIGYTFQLRVTDQTGREYPATFSTTYNSIGTCTPDGLLTGVHTGGGGSGGLQAVLADGRVLQAKYCVYQIPRWLRHPSVSVSVSEPSIRLADVESDVGPVAYQNLTVTVADESIAIYGSGCLYPRKVGVTVVTLTANHGGVSTSFTVEVLPADDQLYLGSDTMEIPSNMSAYLPVVTDYQGNVVPVTWAITHLSPGHDNPGNAGFTLDQEKGVLTCLWPTATCEVTGVSAEGLKVKISAFGYKLPSAIHLAGELTMDIQSTGAYSVRISYDEPGCKAGPVLWVAENDELFTYYQYTEDQEFNSFEARKTGTTRIAAMLLDGTCAVCTVHVIDSSQVLPGDVNGDGVIDGRDSIRLLRYLAGADAVITWQSADINQDGTVDGRDSIRLLKMLL